MLISLSFLFYIFINTEQAFVFHLVANSCIVHNHIVVLFFHFPLWKDFHIFQKLLDKFLKKVIKKTVRGHRIPFS